MKQRNPPPANLPAIVMENVAVGAMRDQDLVVIRDVNWTVQPREYWVLAGLQGSGKSDFLMLTGGLMPPVSGSYRLFGEPMPIFEESRLQQRLWLGLVFESGQLFNHLTVRENIGLPIRYHYNLTKAAAAPEVQRFLVAMELESWADSTPGALSRNWQRRVGLARALILEPELLLLDNPLGGLDLRHSQWWLGFLDQLVKGHDLLERRPVTVVLTAADLRPWRSRSSHFAVIRDQRFAVMSDWGQLQAESGELMQELLMTEAPSRQ